MTRFAKNVSTVLTLALVCLFPVHSLASQPALVASPDETLSLWVMDNGIGSQRALGRIVKRFQRETKIPVSIRFLNWGEAFAEISKALSGADSAAANGNGPDVLQLGSTWVPFFASSGAIEPLDAYLEQVGATRFFRESFKAARLPQDSLVYSFPWFVDVRALYANEKMWKKLALKKEEVDSYSEFIGVLRAFAKNAAGGSDSAAKVAPFALPGKGDWTGPQHMAPFIWSFGGDFITKTSAGYRSALLDSTTLKGLAYYLRIFADREISPYGLDENSVQETERFIGGGQLVLYGTSEIIRQMEIASKDGGLKDSPIAEDGITIVEPLAGHSGIVSFVGGSHLVLPKAHRPAAERLLCYLLRADNMDAYTRQVGFLPADESIVNIWDKDARYSKIIETMKTGKSFPNIPEWVAIEGILIEFSNALGDLFREGSSREAVEDQVVELFWDAHQKINKSLGYADTLDKSGIVSHIKGLLFASVEEVTPESMTVVVEDEGGSIWVFVLVVVIAAVAAIAGMALSALIRKK